MHDFVRGNVHDAITFSAQRALAAGVAALAVDVPFTVDFDHEFGAGRVETGDVTLEHDLPAEGDAELPLAQREQK